MNRMARNACIFLLIIFAVFSISGCESNSGSVDSGGSRGSTKDFLRPEASGTSVYSGNSIIVDVSNTSDGYIMIKNSGSCDRIKIQIQGPDSDTYTYTSTSNRYETLPLTDGNGSYSIKVFENLYDDMYSIALSESIDVTIENEFSPFLYPNQYVWYESGMSVMDLGAEFSQASSNDIEYIEKVYQYITGNITYDDEKASNLPTDYVPDIQETYDDGTGICMDYASLMAALLRSQGIPTKLQVGYTGTEYHAWISIYTEETGWADDVIQFDGKHWSLADPTLGASNSKQAVKKYIKDKKNYTVEYSY